MSIARRATYDFISQIGMQAVSLVAGILIARLFNAEGKGIWQAVMMAATVGTAFSNFGSRVANQYIVGKDRARARQAHALTILLALASSALCFAAFFIFGPAVVQRSRAADIPSSQTNLLLWAAIVLPLMLYNYGWGGILIGLGRVRELAKFNFLFQLAQALAWIVGLILGAGIPQLLMIWAVSWIAGVVWMALLLRDHPPRLTGGWQLMRENLRYGLTAFSGNFAVNVMRFFNKMIMLGQNIAAFSIFTTADGYASKFFLHPEALEKGAFASVTSTTQEDAVRLVCRLVRVSLAIGVVVWIGGGIASSLLLYLNGPEFIAGIAPLWILMLGPLANGGSRMIAMYYSGQLGKPRIPSTLAWIGAGMNVLLVYVGVRMGGMLGAAVGTSLSYVVHFILYAILFQRAMRAHNLRLRHLLFLQSGDWPLLKKHLGVK